jgi:HAD superfamily hydrolase (TIGR01490 family)
LSASYFDVDGTLVATNLVHPTLYYLANQGTPVQVARRLGKALLRAPTMAWAELWDRRTFNELLYSSYQGMSEDRLEILADDVFEDVIRPSLFPYAKSLVDQSKRAGLKVVFVSGALECVLRKVGDYFGADEIVGNRLEMKDGIATGKILKPVVAGPEKARLIREHAKKHGHDLDDCFAFSDSYSDVPMLSVVGHPAAVNPDKRLALLAKAYSWPRFDLTQTL